MSETRRIFLRNFSVEASIGIHPAEKQARQRLLINVDLSLRPQQVTGDDIGQVLDYDFLRTGIAKLIAAKHYNLQETLCQDIVDLCLASSQAIAARVSTEKPDVYADCDGVGYEIYREKP
ncbi:MAG: dihydroneopterin aldolase [Rhodospirillales bacterium]